ncbi:Hypothetical protein D9617_2g054370 [Elsinoe fawcettii]|nr:Hypothetical protein D9617_2g054370 [Elsinoe fawcettii]
MKLSIPTAITSLLAVAAAAPAAEPAAVAIADAEPQISPGFGTFILTSYLTPTCGTARGISTFSQTSCTVLNFPARSVQFRTTSGIPRNCILFGYINDTCTGTSFLTITGPSEQNKCYQTSSGFGANAFIRSIRLQCSR